MPKPYIVNDYSSIPILDFDVKAFLTESQSDEVGNKDLKVVPIVLRKRMYIQNLIC